MKLATDSVPVTSADAFGQAIAARLSEGADAVPHEIAERLKAARAQAVARRKIANFVLPAASANLNAGNEAVLQLGGDGDGEGWWERLASAVPLIALVVGLVCIGILQDDKRANELAEVDAELLIDELPPQAYADPGFVHYLHVNRLR